MDKIDGPYYFFKLIQRMRQILPPWMPSVGLEGGRVNIVPVDYVVDALDAISHQAGIAKRCFHLVDPVGYRVGDVLDIFSRAAHAPRTRSSRAPSDDGPACARSPSRCTPSGWRVTDSQLSPARWRRTRSMPCVPR